MPDYGQKARGWLRSLNPLNKVLDAANKTAGPAPQPAKAVTDVPFGVRTDPSKPETMPKATPMAEMQRTKRKVKR